MNESDKEARMSHDTSRSNVAINFFYDSQDLPPQISDFDGRADLAVRLWHADSDVERPLGTI